MLDGRLETMHCGTPCFAVYGKEEFINNLIDYIRSNSGLPAEIRIIGGLDVMGRMKITITGKIIDELSLEDFQLIILNNNTNSD
ncbi:hypothetical protein LWV32_00025 [Enterobacter asburiae]|uniref:hypothetical protein n=1 Tax=Enterobacter asburiae TaxID=61645 RepID=UPI000BA17F15|nr:hypothetical protein [Enterobacter asburiae]MCE1340182.1 hypothetical protein [Enterobacter asburiae]OZP69682.1 hypothetical protein CIG53_00025 [Enterobacter asburiae]QBB05616.1 hypothetical protein EVV94_11810 [Enterobacter cloacae]